MSFTANPSRRTLAFIARSSFALLAVAIGAPMLVRALGAPTIAAALELPFALACHRIPERIVEIGGVPMPLCSRCAGIWLGLAFGGALAFPALPMKALRVVLPVALALMLLDVVTQDLGIHPLWHSTRIATGLLVGLSVGGAAGHLIATELGPLLPPRERR